MEGIRLRCDSTGSTKNAFYQGTIVSDSRHNDTGNDRHVSLTNNQGYSRRKRRMKSNSHKSNHPPLPRRPPENSNALQLSENSILDAGNKQVFELSIDSNADESTNDLVQKDSFHLPRDPHYGMANQRSQLTKTDQLNVDAYYGTVADSFPKPNVQSKPMYIATFDTSDKPYVDYRRAPGLSSVTSVNSGVYFAQSTPSQPLLRSEMARENPQTSFQSTIPYRSFDFYPTQQASNSYQDYGSTNMLPSQKDCSGSLTMPTSPTIDTADESSVKSNFSNQITEKIDITGWLMKDVEIDDDGLPFFQGTANWKIAGIIRWLLYNPLYPEFTSLQQFCWAVVLGVFMGIFTAAWKLLIDTCVEFIWKTLPEKLLQLGLFTGLNGKFPLYHYMWITPGLLSGILTYVSHILPTPIPTQDDWIHTLHSNGIQESDTFVPTFVISTIGMASGLSLGPELPLILTAGMIGSCLGRACRQSLLQARVMNLTAASAAIGGMFGFPLAGGIFVMELPHRMGLQYFEALSPATIASIVAVLINRIVINNDVTGMFQYPFLSESLPSYIFKDAIIYGLFGGALGIFYTYSVKIIKKTTLHLLDCCGMSPVIDNNTNSTNVEFPGEPRSQSLQNLSSPTKTTSNRNVIRGSPLAGMIPHTPTRAALTSTFAGITVGVTGIFLPHVMFWGEAQLQTLIDKRKTPLPIFGQGDEPTAALVALGKCMMNQSEESGLSIRCSIAIVMAKIFVTGLSLGTGIVGGHFWAPLFVGAAASQFFTEFIGHWSELLNVSTTLVEYPCVALLCIMGATHVVTFRAHMAIILILTLTIDAFVPEDYKLRNLKVAGDYSAVFPLLTVAVFVALQISRRMTFYEKQRCRGDIQALPEALCEPGKEGKPLVMDYDGKVHALDESDHDYETDFDSNDGDSDVVNADNICTSMIRDDIEANFQAISKMRSAFPASNAKKRVSVDESNEILPEKLSKELVVFGVSGAGSFSGVPRKVSTRKKLGNDSKRKKRMKTLETLLNGTIQGLNTNGPESSSSVRKRKTQHRRTKSEPLLFEDINHHVDAALNGALNNLKRPVLKRVDSYGEIDQGQPSLMDQARLRAASIAKADSGTKKKY